jgi:gliding motility-associated-like protein
MNILIPCCLSPTYMKRNLLTLTLLALLFHFFSPAFGQSLSATAVKGNISACAGTASASPYLQLFYVSANALTTAITATAPEGFEVSLNANVGFGPLISIPETGGVIDSVPVYVRSAAADLAGNVAGNVLLNSAGIASQTVPVTGTITALPVMLAPPNQILPSGSLTAAINFAGTANVYQWVNSTTSIGLAAAGKGNISSFTAINTGTAPVTATISATPQNASGGYAYITCWGQAPEDIGTVAVINTATDSVVTIIPVGTFPNAACVSPDGSLVYVVNDLSNSVSVISALTNTVIASFPVGQNPFWDALSPDGSLLYITNSNTATVSVYNTATYTLIATIPIGVYPSGIAVSPDGSQVYAISEAAGTVSVINSATNMVTANITVGAAPLSVVVSPNGSFVYVVNQGSNNLSVISTAINAVVATIPLGNEPEGITISPDGSTLYVTRSGISNVAVISTATNTIINSIYVGNGPAGLTISPDGTQVFVANESTNTISIINTALGVVTALDTISYEPTGFGNFISRAIICTGTPVSFTITVMPVDTILATPPSGIISACVGMASASPNIAQCYVSGTGLTGAITATSPANFEVSLNISGGYGTSVTIPESAGVIDSVLIYVRAAATAPPGNIAGNVSLSSPGATSQKVNATGTINPLVTTSVSITPSANAVCAGTPVIFTASALNGSTSTEYQWAVNGNPVGSNDSVFTTGMLTNGDIVTCTFTGNASCPANPTAASNPLSIQINPEIMPVLNIAASANNICAGTPVTFTATPINGGTFPSFLWFLDGSPAGEDSAGFTSAGLQNGDSVFCKLTSSLACSSADSSAAIYLVVNPNPAVSFFPDTIFTTNNDPVLLTPIIVGSVFQYQWTPTSGISNSAIASPLANPASQTVYKLEVTTDAGCRGSGTITVIDGRPLVMPNAFTPNGDGVNDVFRIPPGVEFNLEEFDVFDRLGIRVFTSRSISKGWDGSFKESIPADAGVYVYIITGKTPAGVPVILKGTVILIR